MCGLISKLLRCPILMQSGSVEHAPWCLAGMTASWRQQRSLTGARELMGCQTQLQSCGHFLPHSSSLVSPVFNDAKNAVGTDLAHHVQARCA